MFLVHDAKKGKTFESNNIFISFLSLKGCSISVRVQFIDLNKPRMVRQEKDEDEFIDSDDSEGPFAALRQVMKEEASRRKITKKEFFERHSDFLLKLSHYQKNKEVCDKKPHILLYD